MIDYILKVEYIAISHENTLEVCNDLINFYIKNPKTNLIIDFSNCNFLYPDYALLLLCSIKYIENKGIEVHGKIKMDKSTAIFQYLLKINFFENLKIDLPKVYINNDDSFLEIQNYNSENQIEVQSRIMKVLKKTTFINDDVFTGLDYCLNEILDNILNHSKERQGWVVAQYFGNLNQIRLMVADYGIGIHKALNERYNFTEEEAIIKCIESGITNGKGQGHGLYATSLFTSENKGWLSVISGSKKLDVNNHTSKIVDINYWQGTCIYLRINTNVDVDYKLFTSRHYDQKEHLFDMMFGNSN
ncbi:MAG: sensor histidine kinase [Flavobacterium sp.]|nr:sensor histidine kinase [Flavobacterium sp.]